MHKNGKINKFNWLPALLIAVILSIPLTSGTVAEPRQLNDDTTVYVCISKYAKRYHLNRNCSGLRKCSHTIREMSVEDARKKGLTPCRKCAD